MSATGEIGVRRRSVDGTVNQKLKCTTSVIHDDHNNPGLAIATGKPLIAFYNFHNQDSVLRYRKSTVNIDAGFGPFTDESQLNMGGLVSYVAVHHSGDTIWAWARCNSGRYWGFVKSTNWAATVGSWSTLKLVFDKGDITQKLYMASKLDADGHTLRCAFANHPDDAGGGVGGDPSVFYAEVDLTSGDITSGGVLVANLNSMTTPIVVATLGKVQSITGSNRAWIYDVGVDGTGRPVVVWADFDATSNSTANSTGMYRYATRTAGTWTVHDIAATGSAFQGLPNFYFGGVQLAEDAATVMVARKSGSNYLIDRNVTADAGATWTVTNLATSTDIINRVWPVEGGAAGHEAVYNRYSVYGNYNSWAGDLSLA
jgi:putative BNR repeat neuraminidase